MEMKNLEDNWVIFVLYNVKRWCNGLSIGLAIERSWAQFSSIPLSSNDSGQVVHTHMPLSPSSRTWPRAVWSVAGNVTAGLAESNGSLPEWLGHLQGDCIETGICSAHNARIEYGTTVTVNYFFLFLQCTVMCVSVFGRNALNIVKDDLIAKLDELTG